MAEVLDVSNKILVAGKRLSVERYSVRVGDKKVIKKRFRILLPEDFNHIWDYIYKNNMRVDIILIVNRRQPQEQVVEEAAVEEVEQQNIQQESKGTGNATK